MKRGSTTKMTLLAGLLTTQLRAAETPKGEHVPGDIGGRFLFGVATRMAQASASFGSENDGNANTYHESSTMELSLGTTPVGVVLGYGVHRDWLLSGSLTARRSTFDVEEQAQSETELTTEVAVSYLLGQGVVRPYIGAQALVLTESGVQIDRFGVGGGGHAGLRVELTDAVSLEPHLAAGYLGTSTHYDIGSLQVDSDAQSVGGSLGLRLAGWL